MGSRRIAHAVRGLKCPPHTLPCTAPCRIAHAVRGLKSIKDVVTAEGRMSHRSRGAWIEIYSITSIEGSDERRIAHAVRGLKYPKVTQVMSRNMSHRSRGAWIEITGYGTGDGLGGSHRSRGAWIEI